MSKIFFKQQLLILFCEILGTGRADGDQWQPPKILSYFEEHARCLEDPDYRTLFKILLLECDYIERHLAIAPQFSNTLCVYFEQAHQRCMNSGEFKIASFFQDFGRRVRRRLNTEDEALMTLKRESDFLAVVRRSGDRQEISLACQNLITATDDIHRPLTNEETLDLLWAYNHYKAYSISQEESDSFSSNQVGKVMNQRAAEIKLFLTQAKNTRCLNQIIAPLMNNDGHETRWALHEFPVELNRFALTRPH